MDPVALSIFIKRVEGICQEMGLILRQAALSPNIKDRLDFSCALFDSQGELFAQAAHIPVHLGSMAFAMRSIVESVEWGNGDVLALNDPFLGGTHLPDVTLISPFFMGTERVGFVVNRAHHANIGAITPGSMPVSTTLEEEGVVIPPTLLVRGGRVDEAALGKLSDIGGAEVSGDFAAQRSANRTGINRLNELVATLGGDSSGLDQFREGVRAINDYGRKIALAALAELPRGRYSFSDCLDDDGCGTRDIAVACCIEVTDDGVHVDFEGTSAQVRGNVNCPLSVAAAAVFYVFRCLLPDYTPACAGTFSCVRVSAPEGSLVNARRPAAVAAGNVETSMRIADVVLGALALAVPGRIPAASQGTMNNVAMGNHQVQPPWDYYETLGGGTGAMPYAAGASAVQSHMTNTLNTPIESLEMHFPLRIRRYALRQASGGQGRFPGGDGLIREFEFLAPAEVTLLTERRLHAPWGIRGGGDGQRGRNFLDGRPVPGKCQLSVQTGQVLRIETPGGGGSN